MTRRKKTKREEICIPVYLFLRAHLGTLLSAPSNRHDPLFGGHVLYICACIPPLSLSLSRSVFQTRSKSFDTWNLISDREIPDPEGDYRREEETFLDPWLGTDVLEVKRFLRMERDRERERILHEILRGGESRFSCLIILYNWMG